MSDSPGPAAPAAPEPDDDPQFLAVMGALTRIADAIEGVVAEMRAASDPVSAGAFSPAIAAPHPAQHASAPHKAGR